MPESTRTFIAIAVPDAVGKKLAQLQTELAPEVSGCRWTSVLPFHLTLAFLGDVPTKHLNEICQAVAAGAESFDPFEIEVIDLGAFPSPSQPRVIWAGVTAPNFNPLFGLHESIVATVARIGHRPSDQRFHPHVTLGRIRDGRQGGHDLTGLMERHRAWSAGRYLVEEVVVFASTLGPTGPSYTALGRGSLAGKKTEAAP